MNSSLGKGNHRDGACSLQVKFIIQELRNLVPGKSTTEISKRKRVHRRQRSAFVYRVFQRPQMPVRQMQYSNLFSPF
jgi:hypothetical protein